MDSQVRKDCSILVDGSGWHEYCCCIAPGKGGEWVLDSKIPVFDGARMAVEATGANTSVIFILLVMPWMPYMKQWIPGLN